MVRDSNQMKFVANSQRFLTYSPNGIIVDGVDYGSVAEILELELVNRTIDTIQLEGYLDIDKDNQFNDGIDSLRTIAGTAIYNQGSVFLQDGYLEYYCLNGEPLLIELFPVCTTTCYVPSLRKGYYSNPDGRASYSTLSMPLWFVESEKNNAYVQVVNSFTARLETGINAKILVKTDDPQLSGSVEVTVTFDEDVVIDSTDLVPQSVNNNVYTFVVSTQYLDEAEINFYYRYPLSKFKLDDKVVTKVEINRDNDSRLDDNEIEFTQKLIYSYDPNVKLSEPTGRVTKDLKKIRYIIHFQNEGNDDAWRVRVVDTLSLRLPIYQFKMAGASHPYVFSAENNIVTWTFNNIFLKPRSEDEQGSQGYLIFDAYLKDGLGVGDSIINSASIYFDYNEPIHTAPCVVKRESDTTNLTPPGIRVKDVVCYPNPMLNELILYNQAEYEQVLQLYDGTGRVIMDIEVGSDARMRVDISELASGIYFLGTDKGVVKLLKF